MTKKEEGNETVTNFHQLKLRAVDGKKGIMGTVLVINHGVSSGDHFKIIDYLCKENNKKARI